MRNTFFLLGISVLATSVLLVGPSEGKSLKGQVLLVRDGGTKEPASPAMVSIVGVGNPDVTKADGGFGVFVPDILQTAPTIILHGKFRNWVLSDPVEGEFPMPENLDQTFVKILLVRKGAPELQSPEHMSKVMEKTLEESLTQVTQDGKADDFDPYTFAREWARKNGVPEDIVLDRLRTLKNQYAQSDDPSKQGMAAIFNKRPDQAAGYFKQAAKEKELTRDELLQEIERLKNKQSSQGNRPHSSTIYAVSWSKQTVGQIRKMSLDSEDGNEAQLNALEQKLRRVTEDIVEDLRKAGNALYTNYKFEQALETYEKAFTYVTQESNPTAWASLLINLGNVNNQIAIRTEGEKISAHLQRSIMAYQQAQKVYSRETFPQHWAKTQVNMGNALSDQASRTRGADSQHLLTEAITAYRDALEVFTPNTLPQAWASTQVNMGTALSLQANHTTATDSQRWLSEAITAYRAALKVFTRDTLPQDWAMTQMNLGNTLSIQGRHATRVDSQRLLSEAVTAYRAALEIYTRDTLPQHWARTQMSLGLVLAEQGTRTTGGDSQRLLDKAMTAYHTALEVSTRERFPTYWAMIRPNIVEVQLFQQKWNLVKQEVAVLLSDPYITNVSKVALQILLILALIEEGENDKVPRVLEHLRTRIASEHLGFFMTWDFDAIKQFLHSQAQFTSSRDWVLKLIHAVERHGRENILEGLDSAMAQYSETTQN